MIYQPLRSLIISDYFRKEFKTIDEVDKFLQNILKMKICQGFPEKYLKPGKGINLLLNIMFFIWILRYYDFYFAYNFVQSCMACSI